MLALFTRAEGGVGVSGLEPPSPPPGRRGEQAGGLADDERSLRRGGAGVSRSGHRDAGARRAAPALPRDGLEHEAYVAGRDDPLLPDAAARFGSSIERRLAGEPVSRILGVREFYGRPFRIDASTLDPRADTETLIEAALAILDRKGLRESPLKLLDLGTGSGCLLITLLAELPEASGVGIDVSVPALAAGQGQCCRLSGSGRGRALWPAIGSRPSAAPSIWWSPIRLILPAGDIAGLSREVNASRSAGARSTAVPTGSPPIAASRHGFADYCGQEAPFCSRPGPISRRPCSTSWREAGLDVEAGHCLWRDLGRRPRVVAASA